MKTNRRLFRQLGRLSCRAFLAGALALALTQDARAGLTHRYSFTTDASDSVGAGNGTLMGNVTIASGAAVFPGVSAADYVDLPPGLVSNYTTVTFDFWVNVAANGTWSEIYGFGNQNGGGAGANMLMFTPHSGGTDFRMSYAQADPGYNDEYVVVATPTLDNQGPRHVTCVYDPPNAAMRLYTNGVFISATPSRALPANYSLTNIYNVYSWLGRSLYSADPPYNGTIDEFRIHDSVLSDFDVAVSDAAGPDRYVASAGTLVSTRIGVGSTNMFTGTTQVGKVLANYANVTNVNVTAWSSNWTSLNPSIASVDAAGNIAGLDNGTATITATFADTTASITISVIGVVASLDFQVDSQIVAGSARNVKVIATYTNGTSADATSSATVTSGATNIISFPSTGRLAAWTNGTVTLTATYRGVTTNKLVTVISTYLSHRWSFNDSPFLPDGFTPNTNVVDSVGTANGSLYNDCSLVGDGTVFFGGTAGHVVLPPDLFTNYGAVTFETWVLDYGSRGWSRIYDFGNSVGGPGQQGGGTRYMFLSLPSGPGTLRGAYTITGGGAGEQIVQQNGRPPAGNVAHIVWTSAGANKMGQLYVNGILVGTNNAVTLTPEDVGPTFNDWLGKAQFNDPYFYGQMNEFRVYNGALDPLSIAIDSATGPDTITNNPGACTGLTLTLTSPMNEQDVQQVVLTGTFANLPSPLPMTTLPQVTYTSGNTRIVTVDKLGNVTGVGPGTTTVTASAFGQTAVANITVIAVPTVLTHRWSFNGDFNDSIGGANATPQGNLAITNSQQAYFDGVAGSYALLPTDLFTTYNSVTFEAWYTDFGSGTWARLSDFGNDTSHYMFLCANPERVAYNAGSGEQLVNATRPAVGVQHHVAWTQDALSHTAKLWIDGVLVGQNFGFTLRPKDVGPEALNYFGKSQYNDPYFFGTINEYRTYNGAISPLQIAINIAAGPDAVVSSPGAVQTVTIVATNMVAGRSQPAKALANYASVSSVPVTGFASNWTSSDSTVAKVNSKGVITAVGAGTATISATFSGTTGTLSLTVSAAPTPVLAHRYSFLADASDSIAGANGTLMGAATISNHRVVLTGAAGTYVQLPGALFDGFSEVTFEAWATYDVNTASSSRLWDFGSPTLTNYVSFTPRSGGPNTVLLYNPGTAQSTYTMTGTAKSYNTNVVHYAIVISPLQQTAALYINGEWKEYFAWTAPLSNITNTVGYLGHAVTLASPPGDLNGTIDEFRIWNGALDQMQIASSYAAGPDAAAPLNAGAVQSVSIVLNDPTMVLRTMQRPKVSATFANLASPVDLTGYAGLQLSSDNSAVAAITGDDRVLGVATGTAHITASFGGKSASATVTVAPKALTLTHKYAFSYDASDTAGKADGTIYGTSVVNGTVVLNGVRNPQTYVQLPRDIIAGYDALTVEAWVIVGSTGGTWERLWDFGNHTNTTGYNYIYQSPYSGASGNPSRLGLLASAAGIAEVDADNAGLRGATVHLVSVVDSAAGTMTVYTNGIQASVFSGPNPVSLTSVDNVYTFIGRSQFNDNWFMGTLDELRVYYGAMNASQVAASYAAGPTPDPVRLTMVISGSNATFTWPALPGTANLKLKSSPALGQGAVWTQVPGTPALSSGNYTITTAIGGQAGFYLLGN